MADVFIKNRMPERETFTKNLEDEGVTVESTQVDVFLQRVDRVNASYSYASPGNNGKTQSYDMRSCTVRDIDLLTKVALESETPFRLDLGIEEHSGIYNDLIELCFLSIAKGVRINNISKLV